MPVISEISGVDENTFLNLYNNNVAQIQISTTFPSKDASLMNITIGSISFQITSFESSNLFKAEFNLKEAFKSLMTNSFNSDLSINALGFSLDQSLLQTYDVDFELVYDDLSTFNINKQYKAFKSVEQIGKTISKPITDPYILNKSNLTFFKCYPFDFAIYANSSIALRNLNTGVYILDGSVTTGVNRVYLSRGQYLLDALDIATEFKQRAIADGGTLIENPCYVFDSEPILRDGYNYLRIELGANDPLSLQVKLNDVCDGVYLKWFNEQGAWSYWLFDSIYTDDINSKVLDIYNTDFSSIETTYHPSLITGKEAQNTLNLSYTGLDNNEFEQVKSIITSPRVELFIGNKDDDYSSLPVNGGDDYTNAWTTVRVLDGTITKSNKVDGLNDIAISIDKKQYTQS